MTNETLKLKWEIIQDIPNLRTYRMRVAGGYIYRMIDTNGNTHAIFVPDIPESRIANEFESSILDRIWALEQSYREDRQTCLNAMGDLSMKLNMMQSSLREFEKQKVEPLHCMINAIMEQIPDEIAEYLKPIIECIEKLESCVNYNKDHVLEIEKYGSDLHSLIYKAIYRIDNLEKSNLLLKEQANVHLEFPMGYTGEKRITDLEKAFHCFKNDKDSFLNLINRIDYLEKENKMRQDTIGCIDQTYNDVVWI